MRSLRDMGNTYQHALDVSIVTPARLPCDAVPYPRTPKLTGREQQPATVPLEQTEPAAPGPVQRKGTIMHMH
jgi:hypothetical protein